MTCFQGFINKQISSKDSILFRFFQELKQSNFLATKALLKLIFQQKKQKFLFEYTLISIKTSSDEFLFFERLIGHDREMKNHL